LKHSVTERLLTACALLIGLSVSAPALADGDAAGTSAAPSVDEIKAAEADFNRGREAYKSGDFVEAAEYFESADTHAPNDRVLELAIAARDKAGNADRAATLAELGLETYPKSERLRKVAAPLVERAHAEELQITVECDTACSLLDGTRLVHGAPALKRLIFLSPGPHTLRAGWSDDRSASKDVAGNAGESASVSFTAPPVPKKEVVPVAAAQVNPAQDKGSVTKPHGISPLVFWIGAGATVVLGGVTVWSGIDTENNPGTAKVKTECQAQAADCIALYNRGRNAQTRTNVLIGATSVVGVATAVIGGFFTKWGSDSSGAGAATASVAPWVSYEHGPSVGAEGRF
jgi:hypothetical protein